MSNLMKSLHKRFEKLLVLTDNLLWILKLSYVINRKKFITRIVVTIIYAALPMFSYWMLKLIIDAALQPTVVTNLIPFILVIMEFL